MITERGWRILRWYDDTMLTTFSRRPLLYETSTLYNGAINDQATLLKILCVTVILLSEYVINKFLDFIASVSTIIA